MYPSPEISGNIKSKQQGPMTLSLWHICQFPVSWIYIYSDMALVFLTAFMKPQTH
jgi:hypothetical protein